VPKRELRRKLRHELFARAAAVVRRRQAAADDTRSVSVASAP